MTLYEIGVEYDRSAEPVRKKLAAIRKRLKTENNPDIICKLKCETKELTKILTDCNKLSRYCKRYYERGFDVRNGPFAGGLDAEPAREEKTPHVIITSYYEKRTDGKAKGSNPEMLHGGDVVRRTRRTPRYKQIDGI